MGRHSRKGRGDARDTSEITAVRGERDRPDGAAVPQQQARQAPPGPSAPQGWQGHGHGPGHGYGPGHGHGEGTPAHGVPRAGFTPHGGVPRVGAPGTPPHGTPAAVPHARGGHPEQREPGGGWGADGTGRGPSVGPQAQRATGDAAGRVMNATPGASVAPGAGPGGRRGPRQEYLDAFDDTDVFAPGAAGAPGAGRRRSGPSRDEGEQETAHGAAREPGPYARDGLRGRPHPSAEGGAGGDETHAAYAAGYEDDDDPRDPHAPRTARHERGGKGRTFTGVAAAAVTTVLAVVIAGQVAGGDHSREDRAEGKTGRTQGEAAQTSRSDDERGTPTKPEAAPLTYDDKMGKVFPLADDFKGKGGFTPVAGHEKGPDSGKVLRYRVDIEKGLPLEGELFAQAVHKTLNDDRSWAHDGERSFERVSSGDADFVITLASPKTTDVWCAKSGLDTSVQKVSCDSAATERIMINAYRWAQGAKTFGDDHMYSYRQMLINHEVGHRLGHGHVGCSKDGALAPVMMQQTKLLATGKAKCRPNAWPYPTKS
ncbi:DUF3152 domain-containing protein [Streptomyces sp. NPDC054796]